MLTSALLALRRFAVWLFPGLRSETTNDPVTDVSRDTPRRKRKERARANKPSDGMDDLPTLLDNLDSEHERFAWKYSKASCINKRHWKMLNTYGPLLFPFDVPLFPDLDQCDANSAFTFIQGQPASNFMYVGFNKEWGGLGEGSDRIYPNSVFAIRQHLDPPGILQRGDGHLYIAGCSLALDGRELAFASYVRICFKTGRIQIPRMYSNKRVPLPSGGAYTRKEWRIVNEDLLLGCEEWSRTREDVARYLQFLVAGGFHIWRRRDDYYQVSTRKKGRVTFCVPPGRQVAFFRNREKDAVARDGKRKRIVHFVEGHERTLEGGKVSHVREHLRGIRRFRWNGYDVAISVPKFHIAGYKIDIPGVEKKAAEATGETFLSEKKVAHMLADVEDTRTYSHGEQT